MPFRRSALLTLPLFLAALAATGCAPEAGSGGLSLEVGYHSGSGRITVSVSRGVLEGETLHARVRRGHVGELRCSTEASAIARIDGDPVPRSEVPTYAGPSVDRSVFRSPYDTSWLEGEPTEEMLARVAAGEYVIDVCLMDGGDVVREAEFDVRRALDQAGSNGKFDGEEEERIVSTVAYAERCVAELGEIPFFPRVAEGDYETYNCLDSTPIPTTVTHADGTVEHPEERVDQCDNPQYIYSLCEPNAVDGRTNGPRVTSAANEEGTHWVLLCRKAKETEGEYNDIAMIGHNPYTGRTCFFQNALYSRTDGLHVPHPGDSVDSEQSPQQSATLWEGIHGGLGSGIECAECHDADPFVHTPWIDGALDESGSPVVPKMGEDDDFAIGHNDTPYSIINQHGQGWDMPRHLVSEEAAPCTECHRIGDERWARSWIERLQGTDARWTDITTEPYREFEHVFWMPPDLEGLTEETFPDSEYARAFEHILHCGDNPSSEDCQWEELPSDQIDVDGQLPEIDLEGEDLARASLIALGASIEDESCPDGDCSTRRCAECHSVSRSGLRRWLADTQDAWSHCGLEREPSEMSETEARRAVNCMRAVPEDESSVFEAANLGILVTGVQFGYFQRLFQRAYGDGWMVEYGRFKARVGMPKGNYPAMSEREYATLLKWFQQDLPQLDDVLDEPPPPETCSESFDRTAIDAHLSEMRYEGWGALNEEAGIRMYGCSGDDPTACFTRGDYPDRSRVWGKGLGTLRQLTQLDFRTSFWMRSSADGRFVGNGGGTDSRSTITDLLNDRDVGIEASYDPGFFPDNSGFIFQGASGGAGICAQSVLESGDPVDFSEPECITARGINLYQHVARGLGGGDYFVINSQFTSDGGSGSSDPSASFNASSTMKFTPMVFDGTTYQPLDPVIVDSPYEGDSVLSPSSELVASRLAGPEGRSLGYVVRRVNARRFGDSYRIDIDERLATICMSGAKPNFSFDERFIVTHHYEEGTANIYLVDLATGTRYQVTNMPEGTRALFPHFRSDGWFYFLVKGDDARFVVASDAALQVAAGGRR